MSYLVSPQALLDAYYVGKKVMVDGRERTIKSVWISVDINENTTYEFEFEEGRDVSEGHMQFADCPITVVEEVKSVVPDDTCKCGRDATELHRCPYKAEGNDSTTLCNCCDVCSQNCADDI
jgi:hypothetical protein